VTNCVETFLVIPWWTTDNISQNSWYRALPSWYSRCVYCAGGSPLVSSADGALPSQQHTQITASLTPI